MADNRALKRSDHIRTQNARSETKKERINLPSPHAKPNTTQTQNMYETYLSRGAASIISTKNIHHKNEANANNNVTELVMHRN